MPTKPPLAPLNPVAVAVQGSQPGRALEGARSLPIALIDPSPWQPRKHFDADRLQELADDIAARGILEPLIVRPVNGRYEIIAGGRRFAAAVIAQLATVPCLIQEWDDAAARGATIAENIHREDLDPIDEAWYYAWLEGEGMSHREIAAAIGKSHNYVGRRLRLLSEPGAVEAYQAGERGLEPDRPVIGTERTTIEQTATANEPAPVGFGELPAREPAARPIAPAAIKAQARHKPLVAANNYLVTLIVADIPPGERPDLLLTIETLMDNLQSVREELEG